MRGRRVGQQRLERIEHLRHALLGRQAAEDAEDDGVAWDSASGWHTRSRRRRRSASDRNSPWPSRMARTCAPGTVSLKPAASARRVDGGQPRRLDDEPGHRPDVIEVVVEARDRELGQVRLDAGMVRDELRAVVGGAPCEAAPRRARDAGARREARSGPGTGTGTARDKS